MVSLRTHALAAAAALCAALIALWLAGPAAADSPAPAPNAHARTVAVVRLTFDQVTEPAAPSLIKTVMEDGTTSVQKFFAAQTGGGLQLEGLDSPDVDLYPSAGSKPFLVERPGQADCDSTLTSALVAVAREEVGPILDSYDHVIISFPRYSECPWAGRGELGGRYSWINGAFDSIPVVVQQLSHNLGADHASALNCTDATGNRVTLSATCTVDANGDPYDVMGHGYTLMSAWHRIQTGELPLDDAKTVSSGIQTLGDANSAGTGGTRTLLIPRAAPGDEADATEYFAVESRGPQVLYDDWSPAGPAAMGLSIRLVPAFGAGGSTRLLDMTPATTSFDDAPLSEGRSFVDPATGIRISLAARDGGASIVEVNGPPLIDTKAPAFSPGGLQGANSGQKITLAWPGASDVNGVDHYEIWRNGVWLLNAVGRSAVDTLADGVPSAEYAVIAVDPSGNRTALPAIVVGTGWEAAGKTPMPGIGGAPVQAARLAGPPSIVLTAPVFVHGRGRLPRSRILRLAADGAGQMTVLVNRRRIVAKRGAVAVRLTKAEARKATIRVVASRGALAQSVRTTMTVERSTIVIAK